MRRLVVAGLVGFALTGCATSADENTLGSRLAAIRVVFVDPGPAPRPRVTVGIGGGDSALASVLSGVTSGGVDLAVEANLEEVVDEDALHGAFVDTYLSQLHQSFRFLHARSARDEVDALIDVRVESFGFTSSHLAGEIRSFVLASVTVRDGADREEVLWTRRRLSGSTLREDTERSNAPLLDEGLDATVNLFALTQMDDADLQPMFEAHARGAGERLARELATDAHRR